MASVRLISALGGKTVTVEQVFNSNPIAFIGNLDGSRVGYNINDVVSGDQGILRSMVPAPVQAPTPAPSNPTPAAKPTVLAGSTEGIVALDGLAKTTGSTGIDASIQVVTPEPTVVAQQTSQVRVSNSSTDPLDQEIAWGDSRTRREFMTETNRIFKDGVAMNYWLIPDHGIIGSDGEYIIGGVLGGRKTKTEVEAVTGYTVGTASLLDKVLTATGLDSGEVTLIREGSFLDQIRDTVTSNLPDVGEVVEDAMTIGGSIFGPIIRKTTGAVVEIGGDIVEEIGEHISGAGETIQDKPFGDWIGGTPKPGDGKTGSGSGSGSQPSGSTPDYMPLAIAGAAVIAVAGAYVLTRKREGKYGY